MAGKRHMEAIDYTEGDEIICVTSHSQGIVMEGDVYIARRIKLSDCGCSLQVDVGIVSDRPYTRCPSCQRDNIKRDTTWWLSAKLFRKLLTDSEQADYESAIAEIMEQPLISTN